MKAEYAGYAGGCMSYRHRYRHMSTHRPNATSTETAWCNICNRLFQQLGCTGMTATCCGGSLSQPPWKSSVSFCGCLYKCTSTPTCCPKNRMALQVKRYVASLSEVLHQDQKAGFLVFIHKQVHLWRYRRACKAGLSRLMCP
jgi:hypothetical protein